MKKHPIFVQIESFFEKESFYSEEILAKLRFAIAYIGELFYNNITKVVKSGAKWWKGS